VSTAARTIDEYLDALPDDARVVMDALRAAILAAAPGATERISYQMPFFSYRGHRLVAIAAWKSHCGMYPMSKAIVAELAQELRPYDTDGAANTIRFPLGKRPPVSLIKKIVKARIKETAGR
jgi:uncharacterized protein YdhG (YjbR/CyaY superfamily)